MILGQPSSAELVVGTLRLPRMVVGLLVGAAFGIAGALIQTVARNPLASPDIIGISQGASALTVGAMTFGITSYTVLPYLSVIGGVAAAALVYVFASARRPARHPLRPHRHRLRRRPAVGDHAVPDQGRLPRRPAGADLDDRFAERARLAGGRPDRLDAAGAAARRRLGGPRAAHRHDGRRHRDRPGRTPGARTARARRPRRGPGVRGDGHGGPGGLRGAARSRRSPAG